MNLRRCYRHGHGWRVAFDYDTEMVERLKNAVPHTHRAWDPEAKEWWVDQDYEDVLLEMFPAFQTFRDQPLLL